MRDFTLYLRDIVDAIALEPCDTRKK